MSGVPPRKPYLNRPRYPAIGAHVRPDGSLTAWSIRSDDPQMIIAWLGDIISQLGYDVLFDHDYSEETMGDTGEIRT